MNGYYYLHSESKNLIFKPEVCVESDPQYFDSPFVQKVWRVDSELRMDAWTVLLEALALGCNANCIIELAKKWNANYTDSIEMLKHCEPSGLMRDGMELFIPLVFDMELEDYWDKVKGDLKSRAKRSLIMNPPTRSNNEQGDTIWQQS